MEQAIATQTTNTTGEVQENSLTSLIKESGLDKARSQSLIDNFGDLFELAKDWKKKAADLVISDPSQTDLIAQAKEAHSLIKDKRIAIEKKHKELKEAPLREGQALDKIKRALLELLDPIEEDLKQKKDFVKIYEETQRAKLRLERLTELQKYGIDEEAGYDLGSMSEQVWATFLSGVKTNFEKAQENARIDKLHIERKASVAHLWSFFPEWIESECLGEIGDARWNELVSEATLAKEKQEKEEAEAKARLALFHERRLVMFKYSHLLNDAQKEYDYSKMTTEKWDSTIASLEKKHQEHLAEQERIRKENEQLKAREEMQNKRFYEMFPYAQYGKEVDMSKLWEHSELSYQAILKHKKEQFENFKEREAEEKAKADKAEEERLALIKKQEEEKQQIQAKLDAIEEEKRQEQIRQSEEDQKARMAPDKDKLISFASRLMVMELPQLDTEAGKKLMADIKSKHELYVKWIGEKASTLS